MKYRPPRTVIGIPSTPWAPCPAARPPAGEPRAGKRGHEADTALEQKPRASARHPPPRRRLRGHQAPPPVAFHASAQSNAPHAERGHVHAGRSAAAAVEREVGRAASRSARPGARWPSTRGQGSGWAGSLCLGPRFLEENGKLW